MNLTRTYWFKTQTISRNLFHVQIECFIIGFSSGKHKSCSYQSCDSRISPQRCRSTLWTLWLSYRHPVSFYQHIRFPNFKVIFIYLESKFVCATWYGLYYIGFIIKIIFGDYWDYFESLSNHFLTTPTSVQWPSTWQVNGPPESPWHVSRPPVRRPAQRFRSSGSIPFPSNSLQWLLVSIWMSV